MRDYDWTTMALDELRRVSPKCQEEGCRLQFHLLSPASQHGHCVIVTHNGDPLRIEVLDRDLYDIDFDIWNGIVRRRWEKYIQTVHPSILNEQPLWEYA